MPQFIPASELSFMMLAFGEPSVATTSAPAEHFIPEGVPIVELISNDNQAELVS